MLIKELYKVITLISLSYTCIYTRLAILLCPHGMLSHDLYFDIYVSDATQWSSSKVHWQRSVLDNSENKTNKLKSTFGHNIVDVGVNLFALVGGVCPIQECRLLSKTRFILVKLEKSTKNKQCLEASWYEPKMFGTIPTSRTFASTVQISSSQRHCNLVVFGGVDDINFNEDTGKEVCSNTLSFAQYVFGQGDDETKEDRVDWASPIIVGKPPCPRKNHVCSVITKRNSRQSKLMEKDQVELLIMGGKDDNDIILNDVFILTLSINGNDLVATWKQIEQFTPQNCNYFSDNCSALFGNRRILFDGDFNKLSYFDMGNFTINKPELSPNATEIEMYNNDKYHDDEEYVMWTYGSNVLILANSRGNGFKFWNLNLVTEEGALQNDDIYHAEENQSTYLDFAKCRSLHGSRRGHC